ncbi:MAG TPA: cyanophycinase [Chloroflexi bacterium]|nr:cyanophycinase [Chloroflexota bacterium]HHW86925.1 cyanophycinase [Chloroflexota bacterium]
MFTYAHAGAQDAAGLLAPVGGGYADVYPGIVAAYLERAQGDAIKLVVLPTTYSSNAVSITAAEREANLRDAERRRFELEEACKRAAPKTMHCTVTIAPIFTRQDAQDPDILKLFSADVNGVFVLGGDQAVAMAALANTPAEAALAAIYARGGVIAGTSAGGALQSRAMIADYSPNVAAGNALTRNAAELWNLDDQRGLNVGVTGAVLDQHFFQRGRMGRLLSTVLRPDAPPIGVGVDAYTGVRIEAGHILTDVFGLYTVAVLDAATYGAADTVAYRGESALISARNVLVHLLAPGNFAYDIATHTPSLAPPPPAPTHTLDALTLPVGAGPLFLTGGLATDSPVWSHFVDATTASDDPLLIVAAGFANSRPAQRAADKLGKQLGGDFAVKVLDSKRDTPLTLDGAYRGIVVLARDQGLLQPVRLTAIADAWRAGTPLLLDGAAAALAGAEFSAHGPTPEDAEAAEIATQRAFLAGRTVISPALSLLDIAVEPRVLADNRWGRLFSLGYHHPDRTAFGIADNAALIITADGATVAGNNVVVSLDLSSATLARGDNQAFVIANGVLDVFAPGDVLLPTPE